MLLYYWMVLVSLIGSVEAKKKEGNPIPSFFVQAAIAGVIGYAIVFPIMLVRRSAAYKNLNKGRDTFSVYSFVDAIPEVAKKAVQKPPIRVFVQQVLVFVPLVMVKLGVYGAIRGKGVSNLVTGGIHGAIAGVLCLVFTYPVNQAQHSENTGFDTVLDNIQSKLTKRGFFSLYRGISSAIPVAAARNFLLFGCLEFLSGVVDHKAALVVFVAGPGAIILSETFASPLERLRSILSNHSFDIMTFLYRKKSATPESSEDEQPAVAGVKLKKPDPDFKYFAKEAESLGKKLFHWVRYDVPRMSGNIRWHLDTAALALAIGIYQSSVTGPVK